MEDHLPLRSLITDETALLMELDPRNAIAPLFNEVEQLDNEGHPPTIALPVLNIDRVV